jgi:DnaJ-class molecular chaperone
MRSDPLETLDRRHDSPGSLAELERLDRLNATSERELLEGYGRCSRCGGSGIVAAPGETSSTRVRMLECPRCGGSGRPSR